MCVCACGVVTCLCESECVYVHVGLCECECVYVHVGWLRACVSVCIEMCTYRPIDVCVWGS